jgi:hypothetical protein
MRTLSCPPSRRRPLASALLTSSLSLSRHARTQNPLSPAIHAQRLRSNRISTPDPGSASYPSDTPTARTTRRKACALHPHRHDPARRGRPRAASLRRAPPNQHQPQQRPIIIISNSKSGSSTTSAEVVRRRPPRASSSPPRRPLCSAPAPSADAAPLNAPRQRHPSSARPLRRAQEQAVRAPPRPPPHCLPAQASVRVCALPRVRQRRRAARVFAERWVGGQQLVHRRVPACWADVPPGVQAACLIREGDDDGEPDGGRAGAAASRSSGARAAAAADAALGR